jgi:hypothetical protein
LSEQRKYRSWTAEQKLAIVLAGLRGDRSVKEVCREHRLLIASLAAIALQPLWGLVALAILTNAEAVQRFVGAARAR